MAAPLTRRLLLLGKTAPTMETGTGTMAKNAASPTTPLRHPLSVTTIGLGMVVTNAANSLPLPPNLLVANRNAT
jgi:hypothetical protein